MRSSPRRDDFNFYMIYFTYLSGLLRCLDEFGNSSSELGFFMTVEAEVGVEVEFGARSAKVTDRGDSVGFPPEDVSIAEDALDVSSVDKEFLDAAEDDLDALLTAEDELDDSLFKLDAAEDAFFR